MMKVYSIEEWHDGLVNGTIDVSLYYQQLQKRNLFSTKTFKCFDNDLFQNPPQNLIV